MPTPIRSILIASDLTPASDEVIRTGFKLGSLAEAEVHVVHSVEPHNPLYPGAEEEILEAQKRVHDARLALAEQLRRTGFAGSEQSSHVAYDPAGRAIDRRARTIGAGVIVIGPHRERPFGDRLLGTTADRVLSTSTVPCLVVRSAITLPLRRILAPVDFSEQARLALGEAFAWAATLGAEPASSANAATEVTVMHVLAQPELGLSAPDPAQLEKDLHQRVEAARAAAPAATLRTRVEILANGPAPARILEVAGSDTDLIVMGTQGRGAVSRALIGSVASAVTRGAVCPVLIVPAAGIPADEDALDAATTHAGMQEV